jgi:hypothetical protein
MGNTFSLSAGGVDAVERDFGYGKSVYDLSPGFWRAKA